MAAQRRPRRRDQDGGGGTAAALGRGFGFGLLALGVVSFLAGGFLAGAIGGLWLALVGYFLVVAAGSEAQRASASADDE